MYLKYEWRGVISDPPPPEKFKCIKFSYITKNTLQLFIIKLTFNVCMKNEV